ncbi:MAG TPA: hypothetical protein ENN54_06780 [Thermoplasmatales archaeon]|nr:hypothetical protein [Thermoplasmatales archaeon]
MNMNKPWMIVFACLTLALLLLLPGSTTVLHPDAGREAAAPSWGASEDAGLGPAPSDDGDDTEYWALMVAVGVYARNPDMDRPSMLVEAERFREMLPVSGHWQEDHIRVITGENATVPRIMQGFRWLDEMEDENDVCLVYLTTHGFPILWDLPPFDEEDGMDEALATYNGFLPFPNPWSWEPLANPLAIIIDDMFNALFNRLESQALGVIVDSCHSGGFNDNWSYAHTYQREVDWVQEFAGELQGRNRVVVTSVPEEDTSYGSYFAHHIIDGLKGYGDANGDGLVSLEEAFYYAREIIEEETSMHPQIFDDYPGELHLTEVELPPTVPETPEGVAVGDTGTAYAYTTTATDPEGHRIRYTVTWGDGTTETTGWEEPGREVTLTHAWSHEGTYDVAVRAEDERGATSDWSAPLTVTMAAPGHVVDQRQVSQWWLFGINNTRWLTQSFVPTVDRLAKLELSLAAWGSGYDLTVSVREDLDGSTLASVILQPAETGWETAWVDIPVGEVALTPGQRYYLVCGGSADDWGLGWSVGRDNPYPQGTFYLSGDGGTTWEEVPERYSGDACFVTYG